MNGLIAYGIQIDLNNVHGWLAWRWILLVEGVVSIGSGFFVMALLPPVPERAHRFFTAEEKQIAIRRSKQAFNTPHTGVKLKQLRFSLGIQ
ncbi:uncharacterized protein APUU_20291S [Aspergillus puulaauensis]|uniref:Major facilitator superfamily (MFS) profile domain-containing protein n=1 Tax=Aspergillus puulaauensis TaxID=1220207 RepID=A0A7R7XFS8_9EURO|nr:uncharacterized protein APUU_20291S [Aspergillus puulaauensis]BCS19859.1 hypothetical protein APUU_20291S [Aspergillus puulaauensis]